MNNLYDQKEKFNEFSKVLDGLVELNNEYPFVNIVQERKFSNGRFVHFETGYNCNTNISFVQMDSGEIYVKEHYCHNYSGYRCYMTPDEVIHEDIGYGFGSWEYKTYDNHFSETGSCSEQDFGCCCG